MSDWRDGVLSDAASISTGSFPSFDSHGDVPVYGANGELGHTKVSNFSSGVLVGRVGAAGEVTKVTSPVWASDNALTLTAKSEVCDVDFLYWLVQGSDPKKLVARSVQPLVTQSALRQLPCVFPSDLKEQRRIAAILSVLDEQIEKTEALIDKQRAAKQGLMQELLAPGSESCRSVAELQLPKNWRLQPLSTFIERFESGVSVNSDDRPAQGQEVGILKTSCVYGGRFKAEENKCVWPKDRKRVRVNPRAGSIIISRMNTPDLVGESGYVEKSYGHIFLPDRLWQTVARTSVPTDFRWLAQVLQWELVKKQIKDAATGTSNSMKNISQGAFLAALAPTPPFEEQRRIAAILAAADDEINLEQNELAKLRRSKAGLMRDLLTGRVCTTAMEAQ